MKFKKLTFILTALFALLSNSSIAKERIISIGGDVTEIIYALNAEQDLVGRDSTSLIPEQVKKLPDIGYMRQLNTEGILALKPTKVITTSVAQPSIVLEQLKAAGVTVEQVPLQYTTESVVTKIKRIGEIVGKTKQANILTEEFTNKINAIEKTPLDVKIMFILNRSGSTQMVAGAGTVADTAIRLIGAKNAVGNVARFSPVSQEGVIAANPDLIVITNLTLKSLGNIDNVWNLPGMAMTNAGQQKAVLVVDDIAFLAFGLSIPNELQKIRQAAEQVNKSAVK
ncbi:hemin ABC transporter substrate-binding protein [Seminibacterium arietis]|uniref:Hemin ABC transporter substrate-binding protein n=1 Tax=Seminibacterium arietis TaxID=1173502 RepID=A0ABW3IAK2_9PAST